jgi:hypothetical protein
MESLLIGEQLLTSQQLLSCRELLYTNIVCCFLIQHWINNFQKLISYVNKKISEKLKFKKLKQQFYII